MKNKFFSGLSAKLALATVALAALTFTSCDKEPFNTQIIYNPARVIITPNVQYVDMASGTAKDVTSSATITFSGSTSNGIIEGTTTNPSIAAGSVNITASYNGLTGSTTVATPALQTGVVTITPTIFIIKSDVYVLGAPTKVGDDVILRTHQNISYQSQLSILLRTTAFRKVMLKLSTQKILLVLQLLFKESSMV